MKVKICGITNLDDAKVAVECGADAIGFIFYEQSKRYISPSEAKTIIASLPFFVQIIGVFVNSDNSNVNKIAKDIGLNAVQLHGNESIDYCKRITHPVIKVFKVNDNFDYSVLEEFSNHQIMLDTFSDKEEGGTGKSFNWQLIPSEIKNRVILAGGISEMNIDKIYNEVEPQAVDLSSSLEIEPGKKDQQKIKSFFNKLNKLRKL